MKPSIQRRRFAERFSPLAAIICCVVAGTAARAEEPPATVGRKWALVVCGLSGDAAHRALFTQSVARLHDGLVKQLGFLPENIRLLFGDEPKETDPEAIRAAALASREAYQQLLARLEARFTDQSAGGTVLQRKQARQAARTAGRRGRHEHGGAGARLACGRPQHERPYAFARAVTCT